MAKITDPDQLTQGVGASFMVNFDTAVKTIKLNIAGVLTTDGVSVQALYSFCKEEWKDVSTLIMHPFPMLAITPEQFEFVDGWKPADQATVDLFRDAGFAIVNANGVGTAEEYSGAITLGSLGGSDQVYYQQVLDGAATDIVLTGAVNQCVKVYGDGGGEGLDNAAAMDTRAYLKFFVREWQKKYSQSELADIGVSALTYQAYRYPLTNSDDLKVTVTEGVADAYGVTITFYGSAQSRTIGAGSYNFDIIIDGNGRAKEEIYAAVQSALRKNVDIDAGAGTVVGETANSLLSFVGDTLVTATGVFIDNFSSIDTNSIDFYDTGGTVRQFPFVAAGTLNFNANLVSDGVAVYRMYFTSGYGTAGAILVDDNSGVDISGVISGDSISFDFDYDGNTQGGRSAGTDADVTVVAIGLDTAQYVVATGTITRSNANSISLVSALERNYTT